MKNPFVFYKNYVRENKDLTRLTKKELIEIIKGQQEEMNNEAFLGSLREIARRSLKKYTFALYEIAEYFAGIRSFKKVSQRARRIGMFFISSANEIQKFPELLENSIDRIRDFAKLDVLSPELQFAVLELLGNGYSMSQTSESQKQKITKAKSDKEITEVGYKTLKTQLEIKRIKEEINGQKRNETFIRSEW